MLTTPTPAASPVPALEIAWSGDVDLVSAPALADQVDALALGPGHRVVLDLSQVAFMDSTGLHVLVRLHRRVEQVDGVLTVRDPGSQVRHLLELTGMLPLLLGGHASGP
ncbi:MAG TPA: STAS domain-containing protein [Jiangellales bacterium]|nr:STAS domain-containing protein [Jiangellales bacterium]